MKKLIAICVLSFGMTFSVNQFVINADCVVAPGDWHCICMTCGRVYEGPIPRYSCPFDKGGCMCIKLPKIPI
jgi:hypothetical protein